MRTLKSTRQWQKIIWKIFIPSLSMAKNRHTYNREFEKSSHLSKRIFWWCYAFKNRSPHFLWQKNSHVITSVLKKVLTFNGNPEALWAMKLILFFNLFTFDGQRKTTHELIAHESLIAYLIELTHPIAEAVLKTSFVCLCNPLKTLDFIGFFASFDALCEKPFSQFSRKFPWLGSRVFDNLIHGGISKRS